MLVTMTKGELRELLMEAIQAATSAQQEGDRMLTAEEAAEQLAVSPDWLYRQAKKLPFTRKLGPKMLRFSYQGLVKYMATRKLS